MIHETPRIGSQWKGKLTISAYSADYVTGFFVESITRAGNVKLARYTDDPRGCFWTESAWPAEWNPDDSPARMPETVVAALAVEKARKDAEQAELLAELEPEIRRIVREEMAGGNLR